MNQYNIGAEQMSCSKVVCGALPDDLHGFVIEVLINTHHKHGGICTGGRDDDFLSSSLQMSLSRAGQMVSDQDISVKRQLTSNIQAHIKYQL